MAAAFIPSPQNIKKEQRHTYLHKRESGDLECIAGSKYQAWVLMLAHGFIVKIDDIIDMGPVDKMSTVKPIE